MLWQEERAQKTDNIQEVIRQGLIKLSFGIPIHFFSFFKIEVESSNSI